MADADRPPRFIVHEIRGARSLHLREAWQNAENTARQTQYYVVKIDRGPGATNSLA